MTTNSTGVVLVRLFSIYLVIETLLSFFYYLPNIFTTDVGILEGLFSASFWFLALSILLPAACAYWLWRNVEFIVPQDHISDEPQTDLSRGMLLGVALIGLWLLVTGLVSSIRNESFLAAADNLNDGNKMASRVSNWAQVIISIPLLFAKERIVAMLLWAKYVGGKDG